MADALRTVGHLCPQSLKEELVEFRRVKGYLPRVVAVHLSPLAEDEIRRELAEVAVELGADITLGREGISAFV